jgi:hypothetical protein
MRNGLVVMIAVLMALAVPCVRLTLPVPGGSCQARLLAWQLKAGQRRARRRRFSWSAPGDAWRRARMIAEAPGHARLQLTPAAMGVG